MTPAEYAQLLEDGARLICDMTDCEEMAGCPSCDATMSDIVTPLRRLAEELRAAPPDMTIRDLIANANLPRT